MISADNINVAAYTFLIYGGLIALGASLFVYYYKKSLIKRKGR